MSAIPFIDWQRSRDLNFQGLCFYILSALAGDLPIFLTVLSILYISIGDMMALDYGTSLVLTAIIGHLSLGELVTFITSILVLSDFFGVILVAKPSMIFPPSHQQTQSQFHRETGVLIALSSAVFGSLWVVGVRKLVAKDVFCTYTMMTISGLIGTVLSCAWMLILPSSSTRNSPEKLSDIFLLLLLYALVCTVQTVMGLKALTYEESKSFVTFSTLSVGFCYIIQITLLGEKVDVVCIIGAVVITTCVMLYSFRKEC
ncbi:putative solute carrier family 35 member G1-like [Apostichopus japonicus]|uniref:Putative solute carrier family 35 member G1-like n=1 Tax=Stichopus japonicus TaxID=307972 RepID=A0A2G8KVM7_STIJA|nr:putative solute carrier family 35 member G1-like [Apostichopus japonicus]